MSGRAPRNQRGGAADSTALQGDRLLCSAFHHSPIPSCILSFTGVLITANRALCDMLGWPPSDLLARDISSLTHPEDREPQLQLFNALAAGTCRTARLKARYIHSTGVAVVADVVLSAVPGQDGDPAAISAQFLVDSGAQRAVLPRLSHLDDAASDILRSMDEVAMLLSPDLVILAASPGLAASLGKPVSELVGTPALSHLPADLARSRAAHLEQVLDTAKAASFEDCNGGRVFANTVYPVIDSSGNVCRLVAFCRDVTREREVEREARERAAILDSILKASPVGMLLSRNRMPVWVNDAMSVLTGRSVEEHLRLGPRSLYATEAEYERVGQALYGDNPGLDVRETQTTWVRGDGSVIQVQLRARPLSVETGDESYIVTAWDITDRLRYEQELQASLELYRGLYHAVPGGIIVFDADENIIDANDHALEILGLQRGENGRRVPPGRQWRAVREDGTPFPEQHWPVTATLRTGRRVTGAVVGLYPAGSDECVWLLVNCEPRLDPSTGKVEGAVVTLVDITQRKRSEAALRESEERFRQAFENAPVGVCLTSVDGTLLRANRAFREMLGYAGNELVGVNVAALTHPGDVSTTRDWIGSIPESGPWTVQVEKRYVHRDGHPVYARINTSLLRDAEGRPLHFITHVVDTTEARRAALELDQSETRFREITDLLPDMVFELDPDLRITYINKAATDTLWYTQVDLDAGLSVRDVMDEVTLQRATEGLADASARGRSLVGLFELRRKDGCLIPTEINAMPVTGPDGVLVGYRGVARDIRERQKAEDAQRLAAVGQLSAGVAHEFNNLMACLMLQAELTAENPCEERYRKLTQIALNVANHGGDICRNLTAFARPASPHRQPIHIEEAIEAGLALAAQQIQTCEVTIRRDFQSANRRVYADAGQMEQVMLNLFVNACHAMPSGGELTVTTRYVPSPAGDGNVVIAVTDTGTGISQEDLPRVFEPFFTTKTRLGEPGVSGSGLGLSVSHGIIKAHGGEIRVRSQLGVGTTFELVLPVHPADYPADTRSGPESARTVPAPAARSSRILVAEDGTELSNLIYSILTDFGHEAHCFATTGEIISALHRDTYDLVITDMLMPGGGGEEILTCLSAREPRPPALVITGVMDLALERRALELGAERVLHKPFSCMALICAVDDLLSREQDPKAT
ncbi:MAG: PAS domain S-box protein [Armatimonadetes bacterium]|nr:PAS domain S-box protein [Armatimonadota bacterium]